MALSSMLKEPIAVNSDIIIRNAVETDCEDIMRLIGVSAYDSSSAHVCSHV